MAKIHEEYIAFKVCSMRRDDDDGAGKSVDLQKLEEIASVIQELVGQQLIVEVVAEDGE